MIDRGKHNLLGVLVDAVDQEAATARVLEAARARRPLAVSALAVHGVMTGHADPAQRARLNRLDLVVPDGQPVRWALNWLYSTGIPERVYGPTLMLNVCAGAEREGLGIYLYGSTPVVLERLARSLQRCFPRLCVAGSQPSRFRRLSPAEQAEAAERIRGTGADVVFVGLGCPRQEVWAYEHRDVLGVPIVAVGAAFDFHAGALRHAPPGLQRRGLEWLFRLSREPRRLWRRYVLLNPAYVALVAAQFLGVRFSPVPAVHIPELRYG